MVLGKLNTHMQKNETRPLLTPYTKINSKCIKDLNVRPETIQFLRENVGGNLIDINLKIFFFFCVDLTLKVKETKAKINKWDNVKLERYCT